MKSYYLKDKKFFEYLSFLRNIIDYISHLMYLERLLILQNESLLYYPYSIFCSDLNNVLTMSFLNRDI